jgi:hypothetical protein
LERYIAQLRREVSVRPVRPYEFDGIEVTRLNEYYKDALRLAELVLRNVFVEDLRHGARGSYGLFINMDDIFESVVERAFREAVTGTDQWQGWRVEGQANVTGLVTGGSPSVTMRPDFVVRNAVDFYDCWVDEGVTVRLPSRPGWDTYLYVFEGAVTTDDGTTTIGYTESALIKGDDERSVTATEDSVLVAFCIDPDAPITRQGTIGR